MLLARLFTASLVLLACGASHKEIPVPGPESLDNEQWIIDTRQGCKIPRTYATYAEQLSWDGPCFDGEAIGHGTLRWVDPDGSEGFFRTCLRPENPQSQCSLGP